MLRTCIPNFSFIHQNVNKIDELSMAVSEREGSRPKEQKVRMRPGFELFLKDEETDSSRQALDSSGVRVPGGHRYDENENEIKGSARAATESV